MTTTTANLTKLTYDQYQSLVPGTKLICVDDILYTRYLREGKTYTFVETSCYDCVKVKDENGDLVEGSHFYHRFALAPNDTKYLVRSGIFASSETIEKVEVISKTPTITYHNVDGDETEYKTLVKLESGLDYTLAYQDNLFDTEEEAIKHILASIKEKHQRDLEYLPKLLSNIETTRKKISDLEYKLCD